MLKKVVFLFFSFVLLLIIIDSIFFRFPKTKMDLARPQCVQQHAEVIQKDLWLHDEEHRIHLRLNSSACNILLSQKNKGIEFEEQMQNLHCAIQDKINATSQEVRYFTSPTGYYRFPSQKFSIDHVDLFFFHLPGKKLPYHFNKADAYLSGTASKANLLISKKKPTFAIESLQLTQKEP
jgi:hypothetical protein